ncbi:uncharacterized protein BCR38DRAFT_485324 [Pseudomassariella vexata]|uniref:Zn(2)-C6 fungal-type domain-containing protein n=1 Tax=Pseudomassariella vexata TaxID=1141098 RepID=A0A1Y2DY98_9PEZI|nr:uncharacterized protein BCR38DRAFT_485324 [Pseudomassariella vexata]ORY64189.1 hypothetical protein BCR38DRAFT_485324 [Pseudomassariella vexata]
MPPNMSLHNTTVSQQPHQSMGVNAFRTAARAQGYPPTNTGVQAPPYNQNHLNQNLEFEQLNGNGELSTTTSLQPIGTNFIQFSNGNFCENNPSSNPEVVGNPLVSGHPIGISQFVPNSQETLASATTSYDFEQEDPDISDTPQYLAPQEPVQEGIRYDHDVGPEAPAQAPRSRRGRPTAQPLQSSAPQDDLTSNRRRAVNPNKRSSPDDDGSDEPSNKKPRTRPCRPFSCKACRTSKVRCKASLKGACERCQERKKPCVFDNNDGRTRRSNCKDQWDLKHKYTAIGQDIYTILELLTTEYRQAIIDSWEANLSPSQVLKGIKIYHKHDAPRKPGLKFGELERLTADDNTTLPELRNRLAETDRIGILMLEHWGFMVSEQSKSDIALYPVNDNTTIDVWKGNHIPTLFECDHTWVRNYLGERYGDELPKAPDVPTHSQRASTPMFACVYEEHPPAPVPTPVPAPEPAMVPAIRQNDLMPIDPQLQQHRLTLPPVRGGPIEPASTQDDTSLVIGQSGPTFSSPPPPENAWEFPDETFDPQEWIQWFNNNGIHVSESVTPSNGVDQDETVVYQQNEEATNTEDDGAGDDDDISNLFGGHDVDFNSPVSENEISGKVTLPDLAAQLELELTNEESSRS